MRRMANVVGVVSVLLLNSRNALGSNQAVSPPPSIFEWLQPFRPIITVSKFPPVVEFIAQRIQAQFSNYIYEDLSRPPTYDRPTYKPYVASTTTSLPDAHDGVEDSTESLAIATVAPPTLVMVDEYVITSILNFNQSVQIEYQLKDIVQLRNNRKINLEQDAQLIMRQNDLKENFTYVFEKSDIQIGNNDQIDRQHDNVGNNSLIYKDVSGLFTNLKREEEFAGNVLRTNQGESEEKRNRKMIALTKIGKHVYVNLITLKRQ